MRIKIQNTKEGVMIQERWVRTDIMNKESVRAHEKESGRIMILAGIFLKMFPRFKEVVVNTELTEDE